MGSFDLRNRITQRARQSHLAVKRRQRRTGVSAQGSGPPLPGFVILGAQKAGTTSLVSALQVNPQIFIPRAKEAHYFDKVPDDALEASAYRRFFEGWAGEQMVGEATPAYLADPDVPRRLHRLVPDVLCLAVLRNPVDRAFSHYRHIARLGGLTTTFEDTIAADEADRGDGPHNPVGYLGRGFYAEQITRYLDSGFAPEQMLFVRFEDLVDRPGPELERIQRFLGVRPVEVPLGHRNRSDRRAGGILPGVLRRRSTPMFAPPELALGGIAQPRGIATPSKVTTDTRARLEELYRDANRELEVLLGWDLSAWGT